MMHVSSSFSNSYMKFQFGCDPTLVFHPLKILLPNRCCLFGVRTTQLQLWICDETFKYRWSLVCAARR